MSRIFISYRRKDAPTAAGRIYDQISEVFGHHSVFKDVDDIPLGVNFKTYLEKVVGECEVLLVIIGPLWASVVDDAGNRRLNDPNDFVRIEIEAALKRPNMIVIPILVNGAIMPGQHEIPAELAELTLRNAASVRDDPDFHRDMQRLIDHLKLTLKMTTPMAKSVGTQRNYGIWLVGGVAGIATIAILLLLLKIANDNNGRVASNFTNTPTTATEQATTSVPIIVPSNAPTNTVPPTETVVPTQTLTYTPTLTPTPLPTETPTSTPTASLTETPSFTPTPRPTETPIPTRTPLPTQTPRPTETPIPMARVLVSHVPVFAGPSFEFPQVGFVAENQTYIIVNRISDDMWVNVILPEGGTGWLQNSSDKVSINTSLAMIDIRSISIPTAIAAPILLSPILETQLNSPAVTPDGLAWDANSRLLWEVDRSGNGTLFALDLNGNVVKQFPLAGAFGTGVTVAGQSVWYEETNVFKMFQLDINDGHVLKQFDSPGFGNIGDIEWDGTTIWAASGSPYRIYQVDPDTGKELYSFAGPIPPGYQGPMPSFDNNNETAMSLQGLTWDNGYVWVSETTTRTVMKVNPYTGAILAYFTLPDHYFITGLAWDNGSLWVSDYNQHTINKYRF